jgi:hypothetical protein
VRKSSKDIKLASIAALAALVATACSSGPDVVADCVERTAQPDGTHRIVDDDLCDDGHSAFYYIYGGSTYNNHYIRGGTTVRPSNANVSTRSGTTISRGGFGGRGTGGGG